MGSAGAARMLTCASGCGLTEGGEGEVLENDKSAVIRVIGKVGGGAKQEQRCVSVCCFSHVSVCCFSNVRVLLLIAVL